MTSSRDTAILAGGCFWGLQDLLRRCSGVISTRVGYTRSDVINATYRNHGTHAEALEVALSQWLHLPLHSSKLEPSASRRLNATRHKVNPYIKLNISNRSHQVTSIWVDNRRKEHDKFDRAS
jgi:hypothetical protein